MNPSHIGFEAVDLFSQRHIGPCEKEKSEMLKNVGVQSLSELIQKTIPKQIRSNHPLSLRGHAGGGKSRNENEVLAELAEIVGENQVFKSYIGMGYYGTYTPAVILRNVLENPGWYTQYTPYQAEIAQGRLEALLNFQTMIMDLTALPIANASLLDEATAAAEAMAFSLALKTKEISGTPVFFASEDCHPQTLEVLQTRAKAIGVKIQIGNHETFKFDAPVFGALLQYPGSRGKIYSYEKFISEAKKNQIMTTLACDLLALTVLKAPGELGADVAIGSAQRFGVPFGYGGPHAAFFATKDEFKRQVPGRIVGVSQDVEGRPAIRLALQTREQHIRRDKATSNICTAQVLLAVMSSMYAIYHGPERLKKMAMRVAQVAAAFAEGVRELGYTVDHAEFFDTVTLKAQGDLRERILAEAKRLQLNFRIDHPEKISVSFDETTELKDLESLFQVFASAQKKSLSKAAIEIYRQTKAAISSDHRRTSHFLTHPVFNRHQSETEMLRYIFKLQGKDLSLTHSMIPLGSCTMKLNATAEMMPVTWPGIGQIHPFAPREQTRGYQKMFTQLENWLADVTGFDGVSLQPNAGSQGEYAGLLAIREYFLSKGQGNRVICLIPKSAHGTNPASAVMAGMKVVVVDCDAQGNVDLTDLSAKAKEHAPNLAALMITYPSTHGVYEENVREICQVIHQNGGQVYMDGANFNAQIGFCKPGEFGPDVCHLNLHKTFCIPHGGGGPGMGPICVAKHLTPFLPGHGVVGLGGKTALTAVSAAPWGSASILPISWMYINMMGAEGLTHATELAILNANYIAKRLETHFPVLYKGNQGFVAHECIFDCRPLKESAGIEVEDIAKRLMDYGFHAPTISFPVAGTMMIEPTESESLEELDRFCEAMISIREEIRAIENGKADRKNNVLKNAPHTSHLATRTEWTMPYSREQAVYPLHWVRDNKFWPAVARINNVLGDRNLVCACLPIEDY